MFTSAELLADASPAHRLIVATILGSLFLAGILLNLYLVFHAAWRRVPWKARLACLLARPLYWRDFALLLLTILVLQAGVRLAMAAGLDALLRRWTLCLDPGGLSLATLLIQVLCLHVAGLALVVWLLRRNRIRWRDAFGIEYSSFLQQAGTGLAAYVATFPALVLVAAAYQALLTLFGYTPAIQEVALMLSQWKNPWIQGFLWLMAVLLVPCFEEILFRGIALPLAARQWGLGPAVLLTSLAFAGIHLELAALAPLTLVAIGFALVYVYSGSLVTAIAMHAVFNAVSLTILLLLRN